MDSTAIFTICAIVNVLIGIVFLYDPFDLDVAPDIELKELGCGGIVCIAVVGIIIQSEPIFLALALGAVSIAFLIYNIIYIISLVLKLVRKPKHVREAEAFLASMGMKPTNGEATGMYLEKMRKVGNDYYVTPELIQDLHYFIPSRNTYLKYELAGLTPGRFALKVMWAYTVCSTGRYIPCYRDHFTIS